MELVVYVLALTLEFFLWFMIGRVVLGILSRGKQTFFTELFQKATFPVVWVVRRITPASVEDRHIPILSIPLLFALLILVRPISPAD